LIHLLTIYASVDDRKEKAWDVIIIYWNIKERERGPQWIWYFILIFYIDMGFELYRL